MLQARCGWDMHEAAYVSVNDNPGERKSSYHPLPEQWNLTDELRETIRRQNHLDYMIYDAGEALGRQGWARAGGGAGRCGEGVGVRVKTPSQSVGLDACVQVRSSCLPRAGVVQFNSSGRQRAACAGVSPLAYHSLLIYIPSAAAHAGVAQFNAQWEAAQPSVDAVYQRLVACNQEVRKHCALEPGKLYSWNNPECVWLQLMDVVFMPTISVETGKIDLSERLRFHTLQESFDMARQLICPKRD